MSLVQNGRPADLTITVVISTRNRGALIAETLRALLRQRHLTFEVLVVDQSTDDRTQRAVDEIARTDPRVRYQSSKTIGAPAGRNLGAHLSDSEIVAYSDDDIIASEDWLPAIVEEFRDPQVAAVFGRLLPYEYRRRTGLEVGLADGLEWRAFSKRTPPWHIGHGGNMAFRRTELLRIGGFDPLSGAGSLLASGEDADICYRLLVANKRIAYSPRALAYHRHWKDWSAQKQMERAYGVGAGALFAKYLRCRDYYGLWLLLTWVWELGVRRIASGLLKWRSLKVMYLGYCQMVFPWIGILKSRHYQVDRGHMTYISPLQQYASIASEHP